MDLAVRTRMVLTFPQEAMVRHEASVITICISQESMGRAEKHFVLDTESEEGLFHGGKGNIATLPLLQHSVLLGLFPTDITKDHFLPLCPCRTYGQGGSRAQHSLCSPGPANLLK